MSKTMRTRALPFVAVAGVAALSLSGCGALGGNDKPEEKTSAAVESASEKAKEGGDSASESAENSSEAATTEESSAAASDGGSSSSAAAGGEQGAVPGVDATPFNDAQQKQGAEAFIGFFTDVMNDDWESACGKVAMKDGGKMMTVKNGAEAKICASAAKAEAGGNAIPADQKETLKQLLKPENIKLEDNGDGTAKVSLMGQDMGINVVKLSDGKVYVDLTNM